MKYNKRTYVKKKAPGFPGLQMFYIKRDAIAGTSFLLTLFRNNKSE